MREMSHNMKAFLKRADKIVKENLTPEEIAEEKKEIDDFINNGILRCQFTNEEYEKSCNTK